jgi:hypothetical protein
MQWIEHEKASEMMRTAEGARQLMGAALGGGTDYHGMGAKPPVEHEGWTEYAGFAGYPIADDGYDWMGIMEDAGWEAIAQMGNWPLVVVVANRSELAMACRVEGDVTLGIAKDAQGFKAMVAWFRAAYPCDC